MGTRTSTPTLAVLAGVLIILGSAASAHGASTADIVFVVDESASMGGEHAWIATMVADLETALVGAGVTGNRYALLGYVETTGAHGAGSAGPHKHVVGGGDWGTAAELATATGGLSTAGKFDEDGHEAIDFALGSYGFRPGAAVNVILITDEDRDDTTGGTVTFETVRDLMLGRKVLLNAVVNATFKDSNGDRVLGGDSADNAYLEDGLGGFTVTSGPFVSSDFGTTKEDYVDLAWATGGAAWDLKKLRAGGLTATSFTKAFVEVKVEEIIIQDVIPEPGTFVLTLGGLAVGFVMLRRRRRQS